MLKNQKSISCLITDQFNHSHLIPVDSGGNPTMLILPNIKTNSNHLVSCGFEWTENTETLLMCSYLNSYTGMHHYENTIPIPESNKCLNSINFFSFIYSTFYKHNCLEVLYRSRNPEPKPHKAKLPFSRKTRLARRNHQQEQEKKSERR